MSWEFKSLSSSFSSFKFSGTISNDQPTNQYTPLKCYKVGNTWSLGVLSFCRNFITDI